MRETNENIKLDFSTVFSNRLSAERHFRQRTQFTGAFASFPGVHKYDGSAQCCQAVGGEKDAKMFSVFGFVFS